MIETSLRGPDLAGTVVTSAQAAALPSAPAVLAPSGAVDLRGEAVTTLRYPAASVVVVAGIPGAGKSTLLHRLFGVSAPPSGPWLATDGALVLDSEQARCRCRRWLRWLPYPLWRPLVHLTYYLWVRTAIRSCTGAGRPVLVHDCGTRGPVARLLRRVAEGGVQVHVVALDVPSQVARAGQYDRRRAVRRRAFAAHQRRWSQRIADGPLGLFPDASSAVILDRAAAARLRAVRFEPGMSEVPESSEAAEPSEPLDGR